jgi:hypothetical protein
VSIDMTSALASYMGQTVILQFYATTDDKNPTTFRIDDVSVQASIANPAVPKFLAIRGPSSVPESSSAQYDVLVVYSNGSLKAPGSPIWTVSGPATISSSGSSATLTAQTVTGDTSATITVTYTEGSTTVRIDYPLTILNVVGPAFSFLEIDGPSQEDESSSAQFTATAIFDDGSRQAITPFSWSVSPPASISNGLLSVGAITSDSVVTISAAATFGGITKSGSKDVLIVHVLPPPNLVSLNIVGL